MIARAAAPPRQVETGAHWTQTPDARCRGCRWFRTSEAGTDWLAIRAAARRHVATTGHHVWVTVTQAYAYRPADPLEDPRP